MKKIFYISLGLLTLICCSDKFDNKITLEDGILYEYSFYEDGKLKQKSQLNEDSILHGLSEEYYESGIIKNKSNFFQGVIDSVGLEYYPSGDLKALMNWNKGKKWRSHAVYYDSLKDVYFISTNNDTVEVTDPLRKEYYYYDLNEKVAYNRFFDKSGMIINEEGSILAITGYNGVQFEIGDTLNLHYYVVDPGWVEHSLQVSIHNLDKSTIEHEELKINKKHNAFFYSTILTEEGRFKIEAIGEMKDQLFDHIKIDTSSMEITVGVVNEMYEL
jgi:hypothetical protein